MLIEFVNCTLEIAHIGTREQIAMESARQAVDELATALSRLGDAAACAWNIVFV